MCQVPVVVCMADVPNLYHVPERLSMQGVDVAVGSRLGLWHTDAPPEIKDPWWTHMSRYIERSALNYTITIGVVGKYVSRQSDAYLSLKRAIMHAGAAVGRPLSIRWIDTNDVFMERFPDVDAIIVPGGFGARGFEDKVAVVRHARERRIPFLGLCLGFQAAVVEFARNKVGIDGATSEEFVPDKNGGSPLVIASMPDTDKTKLGGTMRLGIHWTRLRHGSLVHELYKNHGDGSNTNECGCNQRRYDEVMYERHRHRYEVNPAYVQNLEKAGLVFSGTDCDHMGNGPNVAYSSGREFGHVGNRMEVLELPRRVHPFFVACQYHPEYRSSVGTPHPLFVGLVRACTNSCVATV